MDDSQVLGYIRKVTIPEVQNAAQSHSEESHHTDLQVVTVYLELKLYKPVLESLSSLRAVVDLETRLVTTTSGPQEPSGVILKSERPRLRAVNPGRSDLAEFECVTSENS